jgi:hypothetical protein
MPVPLHVADETPQGPGRSADASAPSGRRRPSSLPASSPDLVNPNLVNLVEAAVLPAHRYSYVFDGNRRLRSPSRQERRIERPTPAVI